MFDQLLGAHAERTPNRIAMRIKRGGTYREWTYGQVWTSARSAAARLRELGVSPGDRVALLAENSPEWVLAYLGIHFAGAVVVPLDAEYTEREVRTVLGFAGCRAVVCSPTMLKTLDAALLGTPVPEILVLDDDSSLFSSPPLDRPVPRRPDELMAVIFTSGTTGDPKGVCLTLGNIASNVQAILQLGIIGEKDTNLSLLPLHHTYALTTSVLVPLAAGGAITFCASLRGPDILAAMRETGVTAAAGVPKLFESFDRAILAQAQQGSPWAQRAFRWLRALSHGVRRLTGWNPGRILFRRVHRMFGPRFRFFVSGGAKLDREVCERLLDLGLTVAEGYGLTETSPVVTMSPIRRPRPGAVGLPLPGVEVRIADPGAEGVGEVLVRGPNVMQGYDRRPEETAAVLRDGWFHTGDLGFLDRDGFLHITGRAKEVIVLSSGKNIYPEDVERCYEQSPLIQEVCVMPVELPDGRVERLRAVVVPNFDELRRRRVAGIHEEIRHEITKLSQGVPSYMRVTELKLVTNKLPRTRLGKLRRAEIRRMALDELAESSSRAIGAEDRALLATPAAKKLLGRIRALSPHKGEILPGHHLELDLGLDSLARVELDVALEQEFGLRIPAEELDGVNTVRDLLRRLSGQRAGGAAAAGWGAILRQRETPALSDLFPLQRGWGIHTLRRAAFRVAQRAFPFDVRGLEHLPKGRPFLLCPNHASLMDAALVFICLPDAQAENLFFLGAQEFFTTPLMRWVARRGRIIPTATTDTVLVSLRRAAEALEMGKSVCIFPESYITRDGFLQRPRPGAGILACEMRVPIVPVLMRGTYDILSYAHPGFRLRPVGLTCGEPIVPPSKAECGNADYANVVAAWLRAIVRLRSEDDASGSRTAGRSPRISREILSDL